MNDNSIWVTTYYFFGLLPVAWVFEKVETAARFYSDHEDDYSMDTGTGTGIGCIGIFFPTRVKSQGVWLMRETGLGERKTKDVKLSDVEYGLLTELFTEKDVDTAAS